MARKKLMKPTRAMKDVAWRTLHAVASDPRAADHARVSAARALVRDDQDEAEAAAAKDSAGPPTVVCLPDNRRDPSSTTLGITEGEGSITIIYDSATEQGLADLARWQGEVAARIEAAYPTERPLLPAPVAKVAQTPAERQRARRARLKATAVEAVA